MKIIETIKERLRRLSFRTGLIVLLLCIPCYVIALWGFWDEDTSIAEKGVRFTVFFGLAKTFQYGGLTILGAEGLKRVKAAFKKRENIEK
jgi:phosphoglycolate phosphatase